MDAITQACKIIMRFEGFSATAYKCQRGRWTIGYGRTRQLQSDALFVAPGDSTTTEAESAYLRSKLLSKAAWMAKTALFGVELTSPQQAALLSLLWNIGEGNFMNSTVRKLLLSGSYTPSELSAAWLSWNKVNGVTNKGLSRRRQEELNLFLSTP